MRRFLLGVNYWPRKKAMYWWKDFDRGEVESEFAEIAELGLHVARIFLFWEDFQPAPDKVSDCALGDLGVVLDIASQAGILVMPTFFTGHMSGINWWPGWALLDREQEEPRPRMSAGRYTLKAGRDPYADPFMIEAERVQIREVCGRFGSHPAVFSWNLSNEPDLLAVPHTWTDGARWNATLSDEIRRYSDRPVSAGMHLPILTGYRGFRPDQLAARNDWLSMHGYSIYFDRTASDDPLNSDVVPLACLVTEAIGRKEVLFEEFGYASSEDGDVSIFRTLHRSGSEVRQYFADDQAGGEYYRQVLEKLVRCGALGAFSWMFSDYDPSLWDRPPFDRLPHERWFGLTRHDGTIKPSGEAMKSLSERAKEEGLPHRSIPPLLLDPEEWYRAPAQNFADLFDQWTGRM